MMISQNLKLVLIWWFSVELKILQILQFLMMLKYQVDTFVKLTMSDGKYIPKHLTISSNFRRKHTYSILLNGSLFTSGRGFIIIIISKDKTNLHIRCPCSSGVLHYLDWVIADFFVSVDVCFLVSPFLCSAYLRLTSLSFRHKRGYHYEYRYVRNNNIIKYLIIFLN